MPILGNDREERDRTYTPLERARRESMRLKDVRYGFFRVAKDTIAPPICSRCNKNIYGQALVINGVMTHYEKCL